MRKIIVEVPEKKCWGCKLIKYAESEEYSCPFREGVWIEMESFVDNARPVKACREAEIK